MELTLPTPPIPTPYPLNMKIFSPDPPLLKLKISKFQLPRTLGVVHYGRGIQAKFETLGE